MTDYSARIAALSPEKRELLIRRLRENQGAPARQGPGLPQFVADPACRFDPFPLTDVQRAYWVGRSGLWDLGSSANVYAEYEITFQLPHASGPLSWQSAVSWFVRTVTPGYLESRILKFFVDRFNGALLQLIERHDMLRAVMLPDGQQQILPQVPPYQVEVLDLRRQSPQQVETELTARRERLRYAQKPMDQWPLFDFLVCLLAGRRIRLMARVDPLLIDGESREHLIAELTQLLLNPKSLLPPVACTYRDYAVTWAAFQDSELYQQSRAYWLARVPTMPPAPELPQVQDVSPRTPVHFETLTRELLDGQAWQQLKTRAAHAGLSPSGIALAAFVEVLAAWSLEPRFTLGLIGTYHPPLHPQLQELVGNFNSLTLLPVENWPGTFHDRAQRLWKQLAADLDHLYFSGHQVLQELNRQQPGSRARVPIFFNSVIAHRQSHHLAQRDPAEQSTPGRSPGLFQFKTLEANAYIPQALIIASLYEHGDGTLACGWQVADAIFPPGMMTEMLEAYGRLLRQLAEDQASWHMTALRTLSPEQVARRAAVHHTQAPVSPELLHTLFAAQAIQRPAQVAVIAGNRRLTYEALYRRTNQIGRMLRRLGARPNTLVAVVMAPGVEPILAVLGILASGAAYLPIDPDCPPDRFGYLLEHGEVQWALTQPWLDSGLAWPEHVQRFWVDDDERWCGEDDRPLAPAQTAEDLACVLYPADPAAALTGVMFNHRGVVNTILDVNRRWNVNAADRVLALSPLAFELSLYDIFGLLAAGGTIVMPEAPSMRDPAEWDKLISRHQVTLWNSPPGLLEMLLDWVTEHPGLVFPGLRLALLSRDRIATTLPERLKLVGEGLRAIELSRAPGDSVWLGFRFLDGDDSRQAGWNLLANQHVHVLDSRLEHRPAWVPGPVYVAGRVWSQGYWRDPDKTLAGFIQHPQSGERLYHTREIGYFLPDGKIEFLGPPARKARLRGYLVELRQIEETLERHPAVRACLAVIDRQAGQRHRLLAYVSSCPGHVISPDALHDYLQEMLPDSIKPAVCIIPAGMPLTAAGQVDGSALAAPPDRSLHRPDRRAPQDAVERYLAQLWETLLGKRPTAVTDNFFELGGSSFLVTRLMTRIQSEWQCKLAWSDFFADPSIEVLAGLIRQQSPLPAVRRFEERQDTNSIREMENV